MIGRTNSLVIKDEIFIAASGGTTASYTDGGYKYMAHIFTSSNNLQIIGSGVKEGVHLPS